MKQAQVVHYKCCGGVFAGCVEPYCFEDSDWMKELRKYSKAGFKIEMLDVGFNFKHDNGCPNSGTNKTELPAPIDPNQIKLF